MKRIYKFTFTSGDFYDKDFQNDLRLLAYLMYLDICSEEQENRLVVVRHADMLENCLLQKYDEEGITYKLTTDYTNDDKKFFNPMLTGSEIIGVDNAFLITVYDGIITNENLMFWLEINKKLLKVASDWEVKVESVSYKAKRNDDETKRKVALEKLDNGIIDMDDEVLVEPKIQHKTRRKLFGRNGYEEMVNGVFGR